ncbi:MAG: glycerate kinase [Lachnospiraceae bacterium]|nr:glycerate kinase [Lachnospiraceae bacterium]
MKILLAPDSFKGSMSSKHIIELLTISAKKHFEHCEVISVPMADGGEGTADVMIDNMNGHREAHTVMGPIGENVTATYGVIDQNTVIIEMATASGLPLVPEEKRNPCETTSYGTGELIKHVLQKGYQNLILAIGGSATNDGGIGAAAALGIEFFDKHGESVTPVGKNLERIQTISTKHLIPELTTAKITIMCDVKNPLVGELGATHVFGKQKGGTPKQLELLENGMIHYAKIIKDQFGTDFSTMEGAGAAGGISIPFLLFSNTNLKSGIHAVLDTIHFDTLLEGVDLVITGEGRVDAQSPNGKVLSGIGQACNKKNIPVAAIVGGMGEGACDIYECGIQSIMPITNNVMNLDTAIQNCDELLLDAADRMFRFIKMGIHITVR